MNDADHDPDGRVALEALAAPFADPHRLVDELMAAQDDADARARVSAAFGLTDRFGLLTRARLAELAESLGVARTPLGSPLHLTAIVDATGRTATVVVDGPSRLERLVFAPTRSRYYWDDETDNP